jgi:filamentous hemagglutinin
MSDYLVSQGVQRGSDEYKQLMMAGSAVLGTVVAKAAGGSATDVALSAQTAKTATENNHNKHHSQINDPKSKGNKASILSNAQKCNGPASCEAMAAGMAGQAATLTDEKIAAMCNGDTICVQNRQEERSTYLQARDLAIAKTGPEGAASIYLASQTSAPYSKSELGASLTRWQNGQADPNNPVDQYTRSTMDPVMFAAVLGISPIDGDGGKSSSRRTGASGTNSGNTPLGLGSTGRTAPNNLGEDLAMKQAMGAPLEGRQIPVPMTDPRWPAADGWVKMAQNVNGVEIHYVRNVRTGAVDDFKFK